MVSTPINCPIALYSLFAKWNAAVKNIVLIHQNCPPSTGLERKDLDLQYINIESLVGPYYLVIISGIIVAKTKTKTVKPTIN